MSICEDYTEYQDFLLKLSSTIKHTEDYMVAVRLRTYSLCDYEINAEIIYWTLQCLRDNHCPKNLVIPILKNIVDVVRDSIKPTEPNKDYETSKLQNIIMWSLGSFCERLLDNVELNKILPMTKDQIDDEHKVWNVVHVSGAVKNRRKYMEDRHICIDNFNSTYSVQNDKRASFYGVFDGHGGPYAACYTASQLPYKLANDPTYLTDPANALRNSFLSTDTNFVIKQKKSGTTVVCALYHPNESRLYIGWVGDSKALLVKDRQMMPIVKVHKPDVESERKRIKDLGGVVMLYAGAWRVCGQLSVSRAIGDSVCKPFVCADPDICCIELDKKEHFLVLGSDGLWDHFPEDEVASTIYQLIEQDCENLDRIPKHLIDLAIKRGSDDNITVVVVFFQDPSKIKNSSTNFEVIEPSAFNNYNMDDINNLAQVFDNHQFNDGLNNILQTNSNLTSTIPITTELSEKIANNFEINESEKHFVNKLSEVPDWAGWGIDNELNKNQASGGGMDLLDTDLDADADLGPETCVDVTDDVVMMTESSGDTNLLDHSTLSNSKDTLPSSDNCNPFDIKIEDTGAYLETNKSTPILSSEFDDDVLLAEGGNNLNQFTNQGFQPSPDEEMASSSPLEHLDNKIINNDNEFVGTNGHLSPKSNEDLFQLENKEKHSLVDDVFMEQNKEFSLSNEAISFENLQQNDEPSVEEEALSPTGDLNQKSEIISDLDELEPLSSPEPTPAVFDESKFDTEYEQQEEINPFLDQNVEKEEERLFEEQKDYFAEETSNVCASEGSAPAYDEIIEKHTEKHLMEEENEVIEKYAQEINPDADQEASIQSQNEFEIKMKQVEQKEFVFEKENIDEFEKSDISHKYENESETESQPEIEQKCVFEPLQSESYKNDEIETDESAYFNKNFEEFHEDSNLIESASAVVEPKEPKSIETNEQIEVNSGRYSDEEIEKFEAIEQEPADTKEPIDFNTDIVAMEELEIVKEDEKSPTETEEEKITSPTASLISAENEIDEPIEDLIETKKEKVLASESFTTVEPEKVESEEHLIEPNEEIEISSENLVPEETAFEELITSQKEENVENTIIEQDESVFENNETFEQKRMDFEIETVEPIKVEHPLKISDTINDEIKNKENDDNFYDTEKANIDSAKIDENELNPHPHPLSSAIDEQASVPTLQQTHESCDDSEDDEWNYMRLKEGQGEKQTIQSEVEPVNNNVVAALEETNVLPELAESKESSISKDLEKCDLNVLEEEITIEKTEESLGEVILSNTLPQASNDTEQDILEDDDMNSQLNPEAKEFVPTFSPPAPGHNGFNGSNGNDIVTNVQARHVLDDVVAQSPRKGREANMDNILLPSENEFDLECARRPHELIEEEELYQEMNLKEAMHGSEKDEYPPLDSPLGVQQFSPIDKLENAGMKQSVYIENTTGDSLENILNSVQLLPVDDDSSTESNSLTKHQVFWSEQAIGEPFGTIPVIKDPIIAKSDVIETTKQKHLIKSEAVSKVEQTDKKNQPKKPTGTAAAKTVEAEKNLKNLSKTATTNKTILKVPADAKKPITKTTAAPTSTLASRKASGVTIDTKAKISSTTIKKSTTSTSATSATSRPRTSPGNVSKLQATVIEKKPGQTQIKSRTTAATTTAPPIKKPIGSSSAASATKAPVNKLTALSKTSTGSKTSVPATSASAKRPSTTGSVLGVATNGTIKPSVKSTLNTKVAAPPTKTSPRSTVTSSLRKNEAIKSPLKTTTATTTTTASRLGSKTTTTTKTTTSTRISSTTPAPGGALAKSAPSTARKTVPSSASSLSKPATTLAARKLTPIKKAPLSSLATTPNAKKSILGRSPSATSKAKTAAAAAGGDAVVASDGNVTTSDTIINALPVLDEHKNGVVEIKLNGNITPIETATEAALDQSLAVAGPPVEMEVV